MVYLNVNYNFFFQVCVCVCVWGGGGSNFFQGEVVLIPFETYRTCEFPGGGGSRPPCPPPSHLDWCMQKLLHTRVK